MKLLIFTQKVDENDDLLGFFHSWIKEFSKHYEKITVVCLGVGKYNLPDNVKVLSLGKENGENKLKYIFNFYKYIWQERKNYDKIFVHMNQEYVLLGGIIWKLLGKKIFLWRNHAKGNLMTRLAVFFSDKVFCTSPQSFTAKFKKTKIMPAGIDTEIFYKDDKIKKQKRSILSLGRISPVKNIHILIDALNLLDKENIDFVANIYGDFSERDKEYYEKIKKSSSALENKKKMIFYGAVPNREAPTIYNQNEVFINLTDSGSFDKTIIEAMCCENLVLICNRSFKGLIREEFLFEENNPEDMASKLSFLLDLRDDEKEVYGKELRDYSKRHDLRSLALELVKEIN